MSTEETIAAVSDALQSAKATAVKVVWEQFDGGWKYVVSVHGLLCEGVPVVHTKFIVWADEDKATLKKQSLTYLFDLNCVYRTFTFESADDIKAQIASITAGALFGKKLKELSSVMLNGQNRINEHLAKEGITSLSVMEFAYSPQFTITPCAATAFQFKLNVSNAHDMLLDAAYEPNGDTWRLTMRMGTGVLNDTVQGADDIPAMAATQVHKMLSNTN